MVQGDSDHDLCTDGSYAEAIVMFTSIDVSVVEVIANLNRRQSGRYMVTVLVTTTQAVDVPTRRFL